MAIEMVRIPSETPNIANTDDFVGLRYAYGNQNGYVIDKGNECSYTINGSNFKINSGRLVLQGIECDIDASGSSITIDNIATKKYFTVYLQVNLALNEVKILAQSDTASYPNIEAGDDLTQNTIGTARLSLYNFEAINGIISNVQKIVNKIDYAENIKVKEAINASTINGLPIKEDENNILKNDDTIIAQQKLIWSGEQSIAGTQTLIFTDTKSIVGRTFKILVRAGSNDSCQEELIFKVDKPIANRPFFTFVQYIGISHKLWVKTISAGYGTTNDKELYLYGYSYTLASFSSSEEATGYCVVTKLWEIIE